MLVVCIVVTKKVVVMRAVTNVVSSFNDVTIWVVGRISVVVKMVVVALIVAFRVSM